MFIKSIAFTAAISMFGAQPVIPAADVARAELIDEQHFSEQGVEIDLYVTRDADGILLSEATLHDPESRGSEVDVWTNGVTFWWDGTVDGERVAGSAPAVDFGDPQAAFCFTPITAIVCVGALVVLAGASSCGIFSSTCPVPDPKVPGGAGGVPSQGGGSDGDDDDGGTDTDTGGESGGDGD